MIILDTTTRKLQLKLSGAVTTNELPWVASYTDITVSAFTPAASNGVTTGATAIDIVGVPGASTQRQVKFISVQNADTVAAEVSIIYNDNGTLRTVWKGILAIGDNLQYLDSKGFVVITSSGQIKNTGSMTDHTMLTNLSYVSAGHTGFAPLASPVFTTQISTPKITTVSSYLEITPNIGDPIILQSGTGKVGIGIGVAPTARLHLAAGTAVANSAPLKFSSGNLLSTPEAGAIEFLSDAFYATITTGATRKTFAFLESPVFTTQITTPKIVTASGNLDLLPAGNADINLQPSGTGHVHIGGNATGKLTLIGAESNVIAYFGNTGTGNTTLELKDHTADAMVLRWYDVISGAGDHDLVFEASTVERVRFKGNGNVGIGINPTARLHLPAGTTVANTAPLKLTAGTNLTIPENGAVEFDGTNLYITIGGVRKTIQVA